MYMILLWKNNGDFLTHIHNHDGSIKLFTSVYEANEYLNGRIDSEAMRVISIGGVNE